MNASRSSVSLRAEKAAQILSVQPSDLLKVLADEGIADNDAGLELLDSATTTVDDLVDMLMKSSLQQIPTGVILAVSQTSIKKIPAKAAAGVLKDLQAPAAATVVVNNSTMSTGTPVGDLAAVVQALRDNRPIEQWDDASVLNQFVQTRSHESEQELDRRSKHQKFIVLKPGKYEPGKEDIDVERTLDLLKQSRKRTTPGVIPIPSGFAVVYQVTALNPQDRIIELCPICGESLYQGYCEKCQVSFADVCDDERAYVRLITESDGFRKDSFSDRKAILASALKGLDDLKVTWPSLAQRFDELKLTNSLPKLRVIENRPSTTVADPYHSNGNRLFGNKAF